MSKEFNLSFTAEEINKKLGEKSPLNENGIIKQECLPEGYPYVAGMKKILELFTECDSETGEAYILEPFVLEKDVEYTVSYNNEIYTCLAKELVAENLQEIIVVGNLSVIDSEQFEFTDEPFVIMSFINPVSMEGITLHGAIIDLAGNTEINLVIEAPNCKSIDDKFLPSNLARLNENGIIQKTHLPEGYPYADEEKTLFDRDISIYRNELYYENSFALVPGITYEVYIQGTKIDCLCRYGKPHFDIVWEVPYLEIDKYGIYLIISDMNDYAEALGGQNIFIDREKVIGESIDDTLEFHLKIKGRNVFPMSEAFLPSGTGLRAWQHKDDGTILSEFADESSYTSTLSGVKIKNSFAIGNNARVQECGFAIGDYASAGTSFLSYDPDFPAIAIGNGSQAEGWSSLAAGVATTAKGKHQTALGCGNIADSNNLLIVGNAVAAQYKDVSDDIRSNAHTLDWEGNAWYAGDVYVGSTSGVNKDEGSKKLATEEYVSSAVANLVNSAPEALNTLNELATALGDDPNFATTVATEIGKKVDRVDGKGLSTNDFTNEYKSILNTLNNIDYNTLLAFDTSEIVFGDASITTSILGRAILGTMILE